MIRMELVRHIAADPAGVALLLAEPASWSDPEHRDHLWIVESPRRVGSGFTAGLEVVEPLGRLVTGEVGVTPSLHAGCDVSLVLAVRDLDSAAATELAASRFLALLADRARARAFAA